MTLSAHVVLLVIGAVLLLVSAVASTEKVDLYKLGWGFVVLAFVFGGS